MTKKFEIHEEDISFHEVPDEENPFKERLGYKLIVDKDIIIKRDEGQKPTRLREGREAYFEILVMDDGIHLTCVECTNLGVFADRAAVAVKIPEHNRIMHFDRGYTVVTKFV